MKKRIRVRIGKFSSTFPHFVFTIYKDPRPTADPLYLLQLPGLGKQGNTVPTAPLKAKRQDIISLSRTKREPSVGHQVPLGHWRQGSIRCLYIRFHWEARVKDLGF